MASGAQERENIYVQLHQLEQALAQEMRRSAGDQLMDWRAGALRWVVDGHYGERVRRVRLAVDLSQTIALTHLEEKLSGISLRQVWPILADVCSDICLYIGGGALAGGTLGAGIGFLFGGAGAVPGALGGAALGAKGGAILLGWLGLKSTVQYLADSLPRAADAYVRGVRSAWGPDIASLRREYGPSRRLFRGDVECSNHCEFSAQQLSSPQ